jgi:hypothetical protein
MADAGGSTAWRDLSEQGRHQWATQFAPSITVDRSLRIITAVGTCPECKHGFTATLSEEKILLGLAEDTPRSTQPHPVDWDAAISFVVACECREDHPGRPPVVRFGCGAAGRFIDRP